jgi:hypothetical protein
VTEPRFHITGPWPDLFDPRWLLFDLQTMTFERFPDRQAAIMRKDALEREAVRG